MAARWEIIQVLKLQQWEKCKGELRAMVMLEGSHTSTEPGQWKEMHDFVEEFIKNFEDEGFEGG